MNYLLYLYLNVSYFINIFVGAPKKYVVKYQAINKMYYR